MRPSCFDPPPLDPPPGQAWKEFHEQWIATSRSWLESIGLRPELLSTDVHPSNKLAHYARACTDVMFTFPFGTQERLPRANVERDGPHSTPDAHTALRVLIQHT